MLVLIIVTITVVSVAMSVLIRGHIVIRVVIVVIEILGHGDSILLRVQELRVHGVQGQASHCLVIEHHIGDGSLEELSHRDVIRGQILGDSSLIGVSKELRDGCIEELCDSDVVGLEEARRGGTEEFADSKVVLKEFSDRNIVVREELCHCDIILLQEVRHCGVQELSHGRIVVCLRQKLRDRDVILKELGDCSVQVLAHSLIQELCHGDIIGASRTVQEFRDCHIIRALLHELSDSNVIGIQELCDRSIKIVSEIHAVLFVVGGDDLVEELGDGDIVASKVLGNGDAILTLEELGRRDVVGGKELRDDIVEEFGD